MRSRLALPAVASLVWSLTHAWLPERVVVADQAQQLVESDLWLQPATGKVPDFRGAAADLADGNAQSAWPVFARATGDPLLGGYARLYRGRAELALDRLDAAATSARDVIAAAPGGYLEEAALWLLADAAEESGRWADAARALQTLTEVRSTNPARAHLRLGRAAFKAEVPMLATQSFTKTYYDFPLTEDAAEAENELKRFFHFPPASETFERAQQRAEQLFAGRRYADARKAFEALGPLTPAGSRPIVQLRLAECDFYLRRYPAARDGLRTYLDTSSARVEEATYFYLGTLRELKRISEYVGLVRSFAEAHPSSAFAESALNDLATYYILANEDAQAAQVFEEMIRRFPAGAFGDRAAWKAGWWAYRREQYEKTVRFFDAAAVTFPRADFRPSWLYWSARANQRLGRLDAALAGYQKAIVFYRNSYYGRQAARRADEVRATLGPAAVTVTRLQSRAPLQIVAGPSPAGRHALLIQSLLAAGLYDDAIFELQKIQRASGTSPFIDATIAYALHRKGDLRAGITAMRRAYPQFMAEGGEALPTGLLKVIFPLEHWDLIRRNATTRSLDPYLIAALVAQESTFQADVRSSANAWGLMQIIPATGRRYATLLRIPRFTTTRLTEPEVNVRIGTTHFSRLVNQFGDVADALAAYNAGENRVSRWRAERPGVDRDEFIDDIPFPETQNYVKRIIGTAEDYRILYGPFTTPIVRESSR